jgi:hypothetical protein
MSNLTFAELKAYTRFQFGNNTAFDSPTDYYLVWVNRAYIQLTTQDRFWGLRRNFYFPQLETSSTATTVDGTAYVSVPTDALIIRDVYDETNNVHLDKISHHEYVDYTDRATSTSEGKPTEWVRSGSYIYLHPTPDSAYTVRIYYRKIPTVLALNTDTTVIGAEWDMPIITLAAYHGKLWTNDYEKAKYLKQEFLDQAGGIITIYSQEEQARSEAFGLDLAYRTFGY